MAFGVAIIGYGSIISQYHADGILAADGLELAGICDVSEAARDKAREQFDCRTWAAIDDCLADDAVEVAVLVLPNDLHLPMGERAMRAGKHVVVEKPMAVTHEQCLKLMAVAKETGRTLTVHQNRRWDNDYLAVKRAIDEGRLGRVWEVQAANEGQWRPRSWRCEEAKGGGMLYDWGAHRIDQMLRMLEPAVPVQVFGDMAYDEASGLDIACAGVVFVRMSDGSHALYRFSHVATHSPRPLWSAMGSDGVLRLDAVGERVKVFRRLDEGVEECSMPSEVIEPEPENWHRFYRNLSAALSGKAELAVKPEESAMVVRIIESAIASSRERKVIDL